MSEFWCEEGWKLAPSTTTYAMCKLGRWDRSIPNCVRPGCDNLKPPNKVKLTYEMNGAIARFECIKPWPELELIGDFALSCDGEYWNSTEPICKKPPPTTPSPSAKCKSSWGCETSKTSSAVNNYILMTFSTRLLCCVLSVIFMQVYVFFTSKTLH